MINFFRKLRSKMLKGKQFRKYSLYALGEIVLVVMGILIALQINNWNEWRKDRIREKEILSEIKINIQSNIDFLDFHLREHLKEKESAEIILNVINEKLPYHDTLAQHFLGSLISHVPTISFFSFESLQNKGLDLIVSDSLRNKVIEIYDRYHSLNTVLTRAVHTELKPNSIPFVIHNFTKQPDPYNGRRAAVLIPNDFEALIQNQELENIVNYLQTYRMEAALPFINRSIDYSRQVIQLIEQHLDVDHTE